MRIRQWILVSLLSLGVSLQGFASVQYMDPSCPMLHGGVTTEAHAAHGSDDSGIEAMASVTDADKHSHHQHDQHQQKHVPSGSHCLGGMSCHVVGLAIPTIEPVARVLPMILPTPSSAASLFESYTSPLHLRPPAGV